MLTSIHGPFYYFTITIKFISCEKSMENVCGAGQNLWTGSDVKLVLYIKKSILFGSLLKSKSIKIWCQCKINCQIFIFY